MTAYSLGLVFLIGLTNWHSPFGLYLMVLATFHLTEYITTALTNPQNLSFDSFLVNHSVQYWAAMLVSWLEYISLNFLFPDLKLSFSSMLPAFVDRLDHLLSDLAIRYQDQFLPIRRLYVVVVPLGLPVEVATILASLGLVVL